MTRKKRDFSREILPDPKYKDVVFAKAVNTLMKHGKKSVAERAMYDALDTIAQKTQSEPLELFHRALYNIQPSVEVRSRRVGGATYQVPTPVSHRRQQALSIRWILEAVRGRKGRPVWPSAP